MIQYKKDCLVCGEEVIMRFTFIQYIKCLFRKQHPNRCNVFCSDKCYKKYKQNYETIAHNLNQGILNIRHALTEQSIKEASEEK